MPFLKRISLDWQTVPQDRRDNFPYNIPAVRSLQTLDLDANVTFFIGENGSGKSTLLEAIGQCCGFSTIGGRDLTIRKEKDSDELAAMMKLSWLPKVNSGFYFRAETFDSFANYIDQLAEEPYIGASAYRPYGGRSLNERSHGQSFLTFFAGRFERRGLYLLDEPESALSPQNQLAFMRIIRDLEMGNKAQFIIATHSPILLAYPHARIWRFDETGMHKTDYEETEHYLLTRDFLNNRERYLSALFEEETDGAE